MKKIGMIGGMSWESSAVYYNLINQKVKSKLGGFHSARCLMESVDFAEIESLQHHGDWDQLGNAMAEAARNLENGGADLVILCTNTMHLCTPEITAAIDIPFIHIADATGKAIQHHGLHKVALLGTRFTMEKDFYSGKLQEDYDIEVMIPDEADRTKVHDIIYKELVLGQINAKSKGDMLLIIDKLIKDGAQGIILGCTEIPLLIKASDVSVPIFDTTDIHASAAVEAALEKKLV